ncbi:MAG TPA: hypothetical protein VMK65_00325 [Longimicrobiales bacterium]|nr:hypothetical protein [Longimicrobiales bacterium]
MTPRAIIAVLTVLAAAAPAHAQDPASASIPVAAPRVGAPEAATAAALDVHAEPADAAVAHDPDFLSGFHYRTVGPSRGGRVTAVAGHRSHRYTFYMGSTGGGVWKTTDYGTTWRNISDGFIEASPAIGAIRVADSDPDVIWVATGSDGIRSNVILGKGVYRSDDAGRSWRHVGLERAGQIGRMAIHPTNPDIAYAAAIGNPFGPGPERGVFKTTDGGRTWAKVLFIADTVGVYGLIMEPGNPDVLYASAWRAERKPWTIISGMELSGGAGIYKSTDAGRTWSRINQGLPQGLIGKIDLAVSPAAPHRIYAAVEAPDPEEGVYRSDDAGATWRLVSNQRGLMNRPFYYTNIHVDPTNPDRVWVNNEGFFQSDDGGHTFRRRSTPHGDNHDMWVNPDDPAIWVQANDGGVNVTLDDGDTWSTQLNQNTAELYQVDVDTRFPYWLYAGQQDNSTIAIPSLPPAEPNPGGWSAWWKDIGGCETGPVVPKPDSDPLIVYANCKGRFGRFSMETGQEQQYYVGAGDLYGVNPRELPWRFQRTVPIEVSPHDPDVVYHGSQYVHRTTNAGLDWETISPDLTANPPERQVVSGGPITRDVTGEEHFSTLYVIEASPHSADEIWAGANDGPVHVTRDGGASWQAVTPPMPPEGRVNAIEISPHTPGKVYVAAYRLLLDDFQPYLFRTTDWGATWTRLTPGTNGIPADHPVRVVREDTERAGLLYVGTEWGMFVSLDDGASWQSFQADLPVSPITDIEVVKGDLALSTMGRGFWILDDLSPLRQVTPEVTASRAHLFTPREAYRLRYGGSGGGPAAPEFPPPGAMIHYWVGSASAGALTLEILDGDGRVIRTVRGGGPGERTTTTQAMRGPQQTRSGDPALSGERGLHRFIWDLRHEAPGGQGRGPLAVPGRYTVRLSAGEWSATQPLELRIDPRVARDGVTVADLQLQLEHNQRVGELMVDARELLQRVRALEERATGALAAEAERIRLQLVPPEDISSYPPRMLMNHIGYLQSMTMRADQRPGRDAVQRYQELRGRVDALSAEVEGLERGGGRE